MAVALQSVSTAAIQTGSASCVITKPTGLAVGDLLVANVTIFDGDQTITPPGSWSNIRDDTVTDGSAVNRSWLFYKIADSGDAAATNFTFTSSASDRYIGGAMYRIDGQHAGTPITTSAGTTVINDATPDYANTVTPSANSLLLFFTGGRGSATTISTYAIATSNPTWTEQYDINSAGIGGTMAGASAIRPEATATGNSSCTYAAGTPDTIGQMVAIAPIVNVSASAPLFSATVYLYTIAIAPMLNLTVSLLGATAHKWTAAAKNSVSMSNTSKNAATAANTSKTSTTWSNTDKTE